METPGGAAEYITKFGWRVQYKHVCVRCSTDVFLKIVDLKNVLFLSKWWIFV